MQLRNPVDGRVHYSDLRKMAQSPAHYRHGILHPKEPTPAMLMGSAIDDCVFGGGHRIEVYDGVRYGRKWEEFASRNQGKIILKPEQSELSYTAALAVKRDPVAHVLIYGPGVEHQRVVHWEQNGLPFAAGIAGDRGGFDVLGPHYVADLKSTTCTQPDQWSRHAVRMMYHCQMAAYRAGARCIGREVRNCFLIGVEAYPPHCVTVLRLSDDLLEAGDKIVAGWCDTLRRCEDSDEWPGYTQSVVECDTPSWGGLQGLED